MATPDCWHLAGKSFARRPLLNLGHWPEFSPKSSYSETDCLMTDPEIENGSPSEHEKQRAPSRPEQQKSGRFLLYTLIALALLTGVYSMFFGSSRVETMPYSEFLAKLEDGSLDAANVHALQIGSGYVTFQDRPEPAPGESAVSAPEVTRVPIASMGDDVQKSLVDLLAEKNIQPDWSSDPGDWQMWVFFGLLAAPFVLLVILMIRRVGGAGSALAFGRSRGKVYAQDDIKVTFDDVAGIDEAVEEL